MLDTCSAEARFDLVERVRLFFLSHGPDLAQAAWLLGGAAAMRRLGCCADRLATAHRIDHRLQRDLDAIHRLLSLADVGDPDAIETAFFLDLDPDSPEVATICRLTDKLDDLLRELDAAGDPQPLGSQSRAGLAT
jgi:hypothetical protein